MAKLHELLAVEADLDGTYKKILQETIVNFTKHAERYFGQQQRVEFFDENTPAEANTHKTMDDTVPRKLAYTQGHIVRYFDAVLQKEQTNQIAVADIEIDGAIIATGLPATFLLGLETKLKKVREVYGAIPTLQPGVEWTPDENIGQNVFKKVHPEEKFRTKKVLKNHIKAEATEHHPAQVGTYSEDVRIARVITDSWCGMMSTAEKSNILGRLDKLIRAVKKARQRANTTKVIKSEIGELLFGYING